MILAPPGKYNLHFIFVLFYFISLSFKFSAELLHFCMHFS